MTAKNAGFKTLAVYDQSNDLWQEETKHEADLYMDDLSDTEAFFRAGDEMDE